MTTRKAAAALIAGGLITAAGGFAGQAVRASTEVSDELFRYPWTEDVFVATTVLWAIAHALVLVGLVGVRASGVAGPSRAARGGLAIAMTGTALMVVAELASLPVRDQQVEQTGAGVVGGMFGLATVLIGAGLTVAGRAAAQARAWDGWRRLSLLACGVWTLLLVGLVLTGVMQAAIGVFGLLLTAIGAALLTRPAPGVAPGVARPAASIALR